MSNESAVQAKNTNKKINLYRTSTPKKTWKTTISDIFERISAEEKSANYMFPANEFNVEDNIELLMTEDPEKFKNSFTTTTPIKNFFESATKFTGKIGGYIKEIANIGSAIINAGEALDNSFNGISDFKTSKQLSPWVTTAPSWDGTAQPLDFSYSFSFSMGQYGLWDAKKEVIIPAFNLIAPVFPQYLDAAWIAGPIPNSMNFATNLLSSLVTKRTVTDENGNSTETGEGEDDNWLSNMASAIDGILLNAYGNFLWDIDFGGHLKIKRCIIKKGDLEFSKETDEYGYPVYARVTLEFSSMIPPALSSDNSARMAMSFN